MGEVVRQILKLLPAAEVIVVNDGSSDDTAECARNAGATVIDHHYSKGNGASIKAGARAASGEALVFMDADGQHNPADVLRLLQRYREGYAMVVGARRARGQSGLARLFANTFYNRFASWIVEQRVLDLTSGFRIVEANRFREFLYLLPNGFSYPTTITMAFFRSGHSVAYEYVDVSKGEGESHIHLLKDGVKFLLIMFRVCTLYSPLKLFFPLAVLQFLAGITLYAYTFVTVNRFTNMSALLLTSALTTFLIGLVSEQITALLFKQEESMRR